MKIEIHLRDTGKDGKYVGLKGLRCAALRVIREAGDKLRLNNIAPAVQCLFSTATAEIIRQIQEAKGA